MDMYHRMDKCLCKETTSMRRHEDDYKSVVMTVASVMMLAHMQSSRQMLSSHQHMLRKMQILIKLYKKKVKTIARYCLPSKDHVPSFVKDELDFIRHLNMSRAAFLQVCQFIKGGKDHGWPEMLDVSVFLYWLASGATFRVVAMQFRMPKSTVSDVVHRCLTYFLKNLSQVVVIPTEASQLEEIGNGLAQMTGTRVFSRAAGCINTFHVRIKPPENMRHIYVNEDNVHSIKCQVVCDHRGLFRDIFIGFPGSFGNDQLLKLSPLYTKAKYPPKNHFLLAGANYTCAEHPIAVVTPFDPQHSKAKFNECHSNAMSIVYGAIESVTSQWFNIFHNNLEVSNKMAPRIVAACLMLHNICLTADNKRIEPANTETSFDENPLKSYDSCLNRSPSPNPRPTPQLTNMLTNDESLAAYTPTLPDHSYLG